MAPRVTLPLLVEFLDQDIERLREVRHTGDEPTLWRRSWDVLRDLYDADQWCHNAYKRTYRDAQKASEDGRVAGGLIWFRGRVQHHGLGWDHIGLAECQILGDKDGELVPVQAVWLSDSGPKSVKTYFHGVCWPAFRDVPIRKGTFNDRDADLWYRDLVAHQGLVSSLEKARRFFATLPATPASPEE